MGLARIYKLKPIHPILGIERRTEEELIRNVASGNRAAQKEL